MQHAEAPSPYRRTDPALGHSRCPNCGDDFPAEELYPVKVASIVRVVQAQNRAEKAAALELARSPKLLYADDADAAELMPPALLNMKSPDWAELPPCIARYRLSLYQLRHNAKMMDKVTSLCEQCFHSFFPDRDPPPPRSAGSPHSPNSTIGGGGNSAVRTPMRPPITFEEYLAQSRFPDRSTDFAFSVVGQCMRHAAAEAKAKQSLRNTILASMDSMDFAAIGQQQQQQQQQHTTTTDETVDWGTSGGTTTGGGLISSASCGFNGAISGLAAEIEAAAVDPLPMSVLDMPFSEWLARELWDTMGDTMEFAHDEHATMVAASVGGRRSGALGATPNKKHHQQQSEPDSSHPFHCIYSHNRLRLPNPPGLQCEVSRWTPPARDVDASPVDKSFARDSSAARSLTVPDVLSDAERKLLTQFLHNTVNATAGSPAQLTGVASSDYARSSSSVTTSAVRRGDSSSAKSSQRNALGGGKKSSGGGRDDDDDDFDLPTAVEEFELPA